MFRPTRLTALLFALTATMLTACPAPPPEETKKGPETCDNNQDDNGDGKTDCADPLCFSEAVCGMGGAEDCINGVDDDADLAADCADPDCAEFPACIMSAKELCTGGADEDMDGKADCLDPDCVSDAACKPQEICNNNLEDTGDAFIDCEDPTCQSSVFCPSAEAGKCVDGLDNDSDGAVDCQDADCAGVCPGGESSDAQCANGMDDDADFLIDCDDSSCLLATPCTNPPESVCNDGLDNDSDGKADCLDPDCVLAANCSSGSENCANGTDDDADGLADCEDPDCDAKLCGSGCLCVANVKTETTCDDGANNDGDASADCMDPDCATSPACAPAGEANCGDLIDNDKDGLTDCLDPDCANKSCGTGCVCAMSQKKETDCADTNDNDFDQATDCLDSDCASDPACPSIDDGQACTTDTQCKGGKCLTEVATGFPGGMCTNAAPCTVGTMTGCNGGTCYQVGADTRCYMPCSGNTGCRPGFSCFDPDNDTSTVNSLCQPLCTADTQCTATGQTSWGCNPWSKFCENKNNGLGKYGAACTSDASCESKWCYKGISGGYCIGVCDLQANTCGGDGKCFANVSPETDNVGTCFDGCTSDSNCRSTQVCDNDNTCWCISDGSIPCSSSSQCCSGTCFLSFCV